MFAVQYSFVNQGEIMLTIVVPSWIVYLFIATTIISIYQNYQQAKLIKNNVEDTDGVMYLKYLSLLDRSLVNLSKAYGSNHYAKMLKDSPIMMKTISRARKQYNKI